VESSSLLLQRSAINYAMQPVRIGAHERAWPFITTETAAAATLTAAAATSTAAVAVTRIVKFDTFFSAYF